MATRQIRVFGDDILTKECRDVEKVTLRVRMLVKDMLETMYAAGGVGLAAPQVGVLKKICVIDISTEEENRDPHVFINPVIIETEGEQTGDEGCLSLPGKFGQVTRPQRVKVKAFDLDMNEFELEAEDLMARAICHECDHLHGRVFTSLVTGELHESGSEEEEA